MVCNPAQPTPLRYPTLMQFSELWYNAVSGQQLTIIHNSTNPPTFPPSNSLPHTPPSPNPSTHQPINQSGRRISSLRHQGLLKVCLNMGSKTFDLEPDPIISWHPDTHYYIIIPHGHVSMCVDGTSTQCDMNRSAIPSPKKKSPSSSTPHSSPYLPPHHSINTPPTNHTNRVCFQSHKSIQLNHDTKRWWSFVTLRVKFQPLYPPTSPHPLLSLLAQSNFTLYWMVHRINYLCIDRRWWLLCGRLKCRSTRAIHGRTHLCMDRCYVLHRYLRHQTTPQLCTYGFYWTHRRCLPLSLYWDLWDLFLYQSRRLGPQGQIRCRCNLWLGNILSLVRFPLAWFYEH